MKLFFLIFFLVIFIGTPALLFLLPWGIGKLLGIWFPLAALIGKWLGASLSTGLILCCLFGFLFGWKLVRVRQVELSFKDLPASFDGYRVAHLSDWHLGTYSKNYRTIEKELAAVANAQPDLIVFTGDVVNFSPDELTPFMGKLSQLKAPDGVWSVMGNHDYCTYHPDHSEEAVARNREKVRRKEAEMGWKMLDNAHTLICRGRDSLALVGVENAGKGRFVDHSDLGKALDGLRGGIFKILLSHDPTHWRRQVLPESDVHLMLSGHTHAMQFKIGKFSPSMWLFDEWGGLYEEDGRKLFVSTGSGGNIPFRFGAWPEVDIITLRKCAL